MKRQLKIVILLVVLLVVALGAYFGVNFAMNAKKKAADEKTAKLTLTDYASQDEITGFDITTTDNEEYDIVVKDNTWSVTNRDDIDINQYYCQTIQSYLYNLVATKNIGKASESDLKSYGLTDPVKIIIKTKAGNKTISVGNATATNDGFYVQVEGDKNVYIIDSDKGSAFYLSENNLKNTRLLGDWENTDVNYCKVEVNGKTSFEVKLDNIWTLTAPIKHEINAANFSTYITSASNYEVNEFKQTITKKDYAKYGFDKPYYILTFKNKNGETLEIRVANKIDDFSKGTSDILFVKTGQIATINNENLSLLNTKIEDFAVMSISSYTVQDIASFDTDFDKYDNLKVEYKYDTQTGKFTSFKLNNKNIKLSNDKQQTYAYNLVNSVVGIKFYKVDTDANPDGKVLETINLKTTDGKNIKYEFIDAGKNRFYVMENGKYTGLVARRNVFSDENSISDCYKQFENIIK